MSTVQDPEYATHDGCGGTVKAVTDEENWPDELITVCEDCSDVVNQNNYTLLN